MAEIAYFTTGWHGGKKKTEYGMVVNEQKRKDRRKSSVMMMMLTKKKQPFLWMWHEWPLLFKILFYAFERCSNSILLPIIHWAQQQQQRQM